MQKRNQNMSTKAQRKLNLSAVCDADQYEPGIARCLSEKQAKALPARHLANGMSLFAELILTHYDGIAEAFGTNNGVELSFKLAMGPQKDELKISYKPVSEVKDAAIATLPDPDQEEMPFMKPRDRSPRADESAHAVDVEVLPPGLPEPMMALPAPEPGIEEQDAYEAGRFAAAEGASSSLNPHSFQSAEWQAWARGWREQRDAELQEEQECPPEEDPVERAEGPADEGPLDLREDLTDCDDEEE